MSGVSDERGVVMKEVRGLKGFSASRVAEPTQGVEGVAGAKLDEGEWLLPC